MSLIKKHEMSAKKLAAVRRNQKLCHGPATTEGRERIRAAHLRHGFYAQAEEVAFRALGEEPAHFQELLEGLWEEYQPTGISQEGLVIRLARATWLMNRADRMQEGYAVRQALEVSSGRQDRLHARMMRLKMTADNLRRLVESVRDEHYVTCAEDLEKMKNLHQEGVLQEMGEITLALFYQLQAPGTGEDGEDPEEKTRRVVRKIKAIFGITPDPEDMPLVAPDYGPPREDQPGDEATDADVTPASSRSQGSQQEAGVTEEERDRRYPRITAAEWEARERPRQLLENILKRQVEICEAQRQDILKESLAGPTPYERAAEIAPTHPNARLMRRMQDSNFREVRRVTNLLLKIKRFELKKADRETRDPRLGMGEKESMK
jgi:hypothetical protein